MRAKLKIGVVGASGFIGSHVMRAEHATNTDVTPVPIPRVSADLAADEFAEDVEGWVGANLVLVKELAEAVAGHDVLINAAGMARPGKGDGRALLAANKWLPVALAAACRQVAVRRLVHVSSAAVQGRLDPLDESPYLRPFSPYTRSKAAAERWLRAAPQALRPEELVIYRPASVHGPGRAMTRMLCRVARGPLVVLAGDGSQPLPVALVDNVASGILFAAASESAPPVAVQPSEGITARRLFELLGARRLVAVPERPLHAALGTLGRPSQALPWAAAVLRVLEVLYRGQRVVESSLSLAGFVPPVGPEGWRRLASGQRERRD